MTRKRNKSKPSQCSKQSIDTVPTQISDAHGASPQLTPGGSQIIVAKEVDISTQINPSPAMSPKIGPDAPEFLQLSNKRPHSGSDSDRPVKKKSKDSRPDHDQASVQIQPISQDHTFQIPAEVQGLTTRYDFTAMSIISSSKLEQKIRNVLQRVNKFNFADTKSKPGIVILHAKQDVASKMISIAEISKKEMSRDKGKWYQYTKLEGHVMEMKKSKSSSREQSLPQGKTSSQWQAECDAGPKDQAKVATETEITTNVPATDMQKLDEYEIDAEQEEPAFETMKSRTSLDDSAEETKKVRNTGIMTIYLSRVPIPELKVLHGEQTNA